MQSIYYIMLYNTSDIVFYYEQNLLQIIAVKNLL